jgi:ABC-type multidrug transport system ATPase subunit
MMEEAEALSDKIMIMHEGEIKAVGTPLELKEKYGKGYKITFLTYEKSKLKVLVGKILQKFNLERETEGSVTYQVPTEEFSEVIRFFKVFEKKGGALDRDSQELRE